MTLNSDKTYLHKGRTALIGLIYVIFILTTVQSFFFGTNYQVSMIVNILFAAVVTSLCTIDSQIRKKPLSHSHQFIVFISWPIALPIYFIWTRKLKGLSLILLHSVSLVLTSIITFVILELAFK